MFIKVNEVSKIYYSSLIGRVKALGRRLLGMKAKSLAASDRCIAINRISLTIREGERIGIIGTNGSGKTTLLQMIAGLLEPTFGTIERDGKAHIVLELGVALREDLTGRENIRLDGEIHGKTRDEIAKSINQVIDFADVGDFIDQPLRVYSSGMKARLAFAMLINLEPEILMIDETLAVGDIEFVKKCSSAMKKITSRGKILILISHSMETIMDMTSRVIWLDQGRIVKDGEPREVTQAYLDFIRKKEEDTIRKKLSKFVRIKSRVPGLDISELKFIDRNGNSKLIFHLQEELFLQFKICSGQKIENPDFRFQITRFDGVLIQENWASEDGFQIGAIEGEYSIEIPFGPILLGKNMYRVNVAVFDKSGESGSEPLAEFQNVIQIENANYSYSNPVFFPFCKWNVEEEKETLCRQQ
ncbi:MAG: ABC transporter ATP-binding protein [Candidatus Omnitrophica bacterium]|nr:ABC transporter ATP-binding protein [Candidatus Omnitrophota bacterium]